MAVYSKFTAVDQRGRPVEFEAFDAMTRCLAVLVASAAALEELSVPLTAGAVEDAATAKTMRDLVISLIEITSFDGKQLRADADALAARLGAVITIQKIGKPSDMN